VICPFPIGGKSHMRELARIVGPCCFLVSRPIHLSAVCRANHVLPSMLLRVGERCNSQKCQGNKKFHTVSLLFLIVRFTEQYQPRYRETWRMAISFPVRLGRRLSDLREKRGLSQTQLADMAEIGRAHLSQIENGAVAARVDTLYAIAGALELTLSDMLKGL
jgi:DNA-binding XRE family transcriptional regulator